MSPAIAWLDASVIIGIDMLCLIICIKEGITAEFAEQKRL